MYKDKQISFHASLSHNHTFRYKSEEK